MLLWFLIICSCDFLIYRLDFQAKNVREEPKGIVFLSKLLLLFQYCHLCFPENPKVSVTQTGTMLTIQSSSSCTVTYTWNSQPYLLGKFPAGNLLLSFGILCAGASVNKVLLVFRHMGMAVYHQPTNLLLPPKTPADTSYCFVLAIPSGKNPGVSERQGRGACRWRSARQHGALR